MTKTTDREASPRRWCLFVMVAIESTWRRLNDPFGVVTMSTSLNDFAVKAQLK